jgi:hypothetical protein
MSETSPNKKYRRVISGYPALWSPAKSKEEGNREAGDTKTLGSSLLLTLGDDWTAVGPRELREPPVAYRGILGHGNDCLRPENTYLWDDSI